MNGSGPEGERPRGFWGGQRDTDAIGRCRDDEPGSIRCRCDWFGCLHVAYFPVAVARNVFGAPDESPSTSPAGVAVCARN